jgi:hypothetical protein
VSRFEFEFTARVTAFQLGPWTYSVVYLSEDLAQKLPLREHPRLRIRGEIGEYPFAGAWQPTGGRWYLKLSKDFLKQQDALVGDWLNIRFNIDDQTAVDLPEALSVELKKDRHFASVWNALTPGKQRSWLLPIAQAKTGATEAKRVAELKLKLMPRQE